MDELVRAVAAEYAWEDYAPEIEPAKLAPARLAELAGSYQAHADRVYRVVVEHGHLVVRTPFNAPGELVALNDSEFVRADGATRYVFTKGADGAIALDMTPNAGQGPSRRVPDSFAVPMDDLAAYRDALACAARDTALGAGAKDELRRKALASLKDLGAAP